MIKDFWNLINIRALGMLKNVLKRSEMNDCLRIGVKDCLRYGLIRLSINT